MKTIDCNGKSFAEALSQNFFAFLRIAFVFVVVMTANNIASAANSSHKVTDVTGTVTSVELTNVDLKTYEKYNAEVQSINKNLLPISSLTWSGTPGDREKDIYNKRAVRFLAKASPGSTISIRIKPESNLGNYYITRLLLASPYKIKDNTFDLQIKGNGEFLLPKKGEAKNYTIRQGEDFIYVCWCNDYSDANMIVRGRIYNKDALKTEYYIFTSDEAFKKAYKIWTGKTPTGPIGSSSSSPDDSFDDWAMIIMITIGLFAGGALIFIIKRLLGKKSAGEKPTGAASQYPQYPQEPQDPNSFVYTDPSGVQTLYQRDPNTGEWFNPSTGGLVNMNDLDRFNRQRAEDKAWTNDQMKNLSNRNTAVEKAWRNQDQQAAQEMQKIFDDIDRQGAKDKAAIRSGTYGMSEERRKEVQSKWQSVLESEQNAAHRVANNWDRATKVAEGVQKAADIGMDIAATAAKAVDGGVVSGRIKDAYSLAKNMAGSASYATTKGKSVWEGLAKGFVDGVVDIAQNNANGVYKTLSYVGGEGFKGGLDAAWKGEDMTIGAFKGALKGTMKLGIDNVGDKIRNGITKPEDSLRNAFDHAREIRTVYSKGISQKSVDALQKMNLDKHLANVKNAEYQTWANEITNALSSNLLPDAIFGE